jgi:hypothetical protein
MNGSRSFVTACLLWAVGAGRLIASSATLTINASSVLTSVEPTRFYGNNVAYWAGDARYTAMAAKVAATGTKFVRYPGGSNSNIYHWNGTGSYSSGIWTPSNTVFTPGFASALSYRGTTSSYGLASALTDGNYTSDYRSDTTTANGAYAYFYLDLGASKTFDSTKITWSNPYASSYNIYVNNGSMTDPPYENAVNHWTLISAVTGASGGTDTQAFAAKTGRWVKIELVASSAGAPDRDFRVFEFEIYNGATLQNIQSTDPWTQTPAVASPTSFQTALSASGAWMFDFEEYMAWINAQPSPKPEPVITVAFGGGTAQEAAAWVHYANGVKGYNIKHWEIGNEMEGNWEYGGPVNAVYYANRFIEFATLMKAEDSSIKIHGPVVSYLKNTNQIFDATAPTYSERFFKELQNQGQLSLLDVINYHIYAFWSNNVPAATLNTPADWSSGSNYKAYIDSLNSTYYPGSPRENMMGEYNSGNATVFTVQLGNGLWLANWLGEYMKAYGSTGMATLWDVSNNLSNAGGNSWGDHAYLENGTLGAPYTYQERAHYWAMHLLRNHFTLDGAGNSLVACSSTQSLLPAYTCLRDDGHLTLLVINKDPVNAFATTINISGYSPSSSATLYTFAGAATAPYYIQNYLWHDLSSTASYADPDLAPVSNAYSGASASFSHTFPSYSLSVFDFGPYASPTTTPTLTPSPTESQTKTPSPTLTPTADFTQTLTATPSPSVTAFISGGPLVIANALIAPNPVAGSVPRISVMMEGSADGILWSVYTSAMVKVLSVPQDGKISAGWHNLPMDVSSLSNGVFYVVVTAYRAGAEPSPRKLIKMMILR